MQRPLRIGIMLRTLDESGGISVYTQYLLDELIGYGSPHRYVLFYRQPRHLGRFSGFSHVTERLVKGRSKALWDQVAIPLASRAAKLDVLFHPKFTVPFAAPCPTVMALHGADWFFPEYARFYSRADVAYIRAVLPLYCRRATAIVSVSQLTTDQFNELLRLPADKIRTTYLGPGKHFRPVTDRGQLEAVRKRYQLPERFILTLTKPGDGGRKNLDGIVAAYERLHARMPIPLVIGGRDCERLRADHAIPPQGWGRSIHFPGWIAQSDLPAVYSLADVYLYPSRLEAFPIPVVEAMACGTPVVTSDVNGLAEIAADAALQVDPADPAAIAAATQRVLTDASLRRTLRQAGLERAARFSWRRCAEETLDVLERAARRRSR